MTAITIFTGSWFEAHGIPILVTILVALALSLLARVIVHRMERRIERTEHVGSSLRRTATLTHSLMSAFLAFIWVFAVFIVLDQLGVNLAPLIAGAGIAGVALGFGAQSLVRDGLSGFFILLENQFDLGDTVDVIATGGTVSGRVESFSMRITGIRQYDGTLNFVPNGNIQVVANRSKGWARAIVDIQVAYGEDVGAIRTTLEELLASLSSGELKGSLKAEPEVLGIQSVTAGAMAMRVIADTSPRDKPRVERILRERVTTRLAQEGIRAPVAPPAAPTPGPPAS